MGGGNHVFDLHTMHSLSNEKFVENSFDDINRCYHRPRFDDIYVAPQTSTWLVKLRHFLSLDFETPFWSIYIHFRIQPSFVYTLEKHNTSPLC